MLRPHELARRTTVLYALCCETMAGTNSTPISCFRGFLEKPQREYGNFRLLSFVKLDATSDP